MEIIIKSTLLFINTNQKWVKIMRSMLWSWRKNGNVIGRNRSGHLEVFCKKGALENFEKFKENTCVRISFLIKLH